MFTTENRELDYLIALINSALKQQPAPLVSGLDMNKLLRLADSQQVYSAVLPALEAAGVLSPSEREEWNNYKLSDLKKTIIVDNERAAICADFDEQGISYMFLKGLVLRNYYPKTSMRQMSDNDILYHEENKKAVYRIMKAHGFHLVGDAATSDDFKKDVCAIDFHRQLFNARDHYGFDIDLWQRAEKQKGSEEWRINKEDNYIYSLCHMYKHYITEGCGIRFLCDIHLMREKEQYDEAYIASQLESFGLTVFNETVCGACAVIFGDKEPSEEEKELLEAILFGTVFGKAETIEEKIQKSGGKLRYIIRKLFPEKKVIIETYTKLEKYPFLLPYYYLKRFFSRVIYERQKIKNEIKELKK